MQFQEYLPLIQAQLQLFYQFILENLLNAGILAVSVWLLTSILYGFRIGGLNRINRKNQQTILDTQAQLAESQAQLQQLHEQLQQTNEQLEQQSQNAAGLQARISEVGSQISANILLLAAEPNLGQQGLTVNPSLDLEQLWQRFSIAVKQLTESLLVEKAAYREIKQSYQTETAKLAEKELQLEAAQLRIDTQKQQMTELEQTIAGHDAALAQQQDSAQQRISAIEAKYQTNLLRLTELEAQALEWRKNRPAAAEIAAAPQPAAVITAAIEPVAPEPVTEVATPEPVIIAADPVAETQAVGTPVVAEASPAVETVSVTPPAQPAAAGSGGKFKSLFANARQKIEMLDQKLGHSTAQTQEINQAAAHYDAIRQPEPEPEPVAIPEPAPQPAPVVEPEAAPTPKAAAPSANKLGSMFSSARQKFSKLDAMFGQSEDKPVVEEPETIAPQPAEPATQPEIAAAPAAAGGLGGKFKGMFGGSKAAVTEPEAVAEPAAVEPEPSRQPAAAENTGGKLKGLLGKFKR